MSVDFPAGGTVTFDFLVRRYNSRTKLYTIVDVSTASSIVAYLTDRQTPSSTLAQVTCSAAFSGADWSNGIVTGAFDNSGTSTITAYGYSNLVLEVTIAGEPEYFYSDDKAVRIVSVPS